MERCAGEPADRAHCQDKESLSAAVEPAGDILSLAHRLRNSRPDSELERTSDTWTRSSSPTTRSIDDGIWAYIGRQGQDALGQAERSFCGEKRHFGLDMIPGRLETEQRQI